MLIECSGISSCDIRSFSATVLYMPVALQMLDAFISPCFESYLYVSTSISSFVSQYFSWTWPTKNGLAGAYQKRERSASWYAKRTTAKRQNGDRAKPPIANRSAEGCAVAAFVQGFQGQDTGDMVDGKGWERANKMISEEIGIELNES